VVFFKAAEQVLLLRQQLSNARHRRLTPSKRRGATT
jgi:hypothetical protein